jgi:hypothetical protein
MLARDDQQEKKMKRKKESEAEHDPLTFSWLSFRCIIHGFLFE